MPMTFVIGATENVVTGALQMFVVTLYHFFIISHYFHWYIQNISNGALVRLGFYIYQVQTG